MKILKTATSALDIDDLYDYVKDAIKHLDKHNIPQSKASLEKAKKKIEKIRPILKNPTKWVNILDKYKK